MKKFIAHHMDLFYISKRLLFCIFCVYLLIFLINKSSFKHEHIYWRGLSIYMCVYIHMCVCTCICMCNIYTYTHICMYMYTKVFLSLLSKFSILFIAYSPISKSMPKKVLVSIIASFNRLREIIFLHLLASEVPRTP